MENYKYSSLFFCLLYLDCYFLLGVVGKDVDLSYNKLHLLLDCWNFKQTFKKFEKYLQNHAKGEKFIFGKYFLKSITKGGGSSDTFA